MGELRKLLDGIHEGRFSAEEAAPRAKAIMAEREPDEHSIEATWGRMAGSVGERDDTDTFGEVTAAWFSGRLTDDQYAALRQVVSP